MIIHFKNQGEPHFASIIFDFEQVSDCLVIVFAEGFNEDILFYKEQGNWNSSSPMQKLNPSTYFNILQALKNALIKNAKP